MKIQKIEIESYGKWQKESWRLDDRFTCFVGKNESGKSTIHQFILGVLFGFSGRRKNLFPYLKQTNKVTGGTLYITQNHQQAEISRYLSGNRKESLLKTEMRELQGEEAIQAFLAPLTLDNYLAVYSIDAKQSFLDKPPTEAAIEDLLLSIALSGSQDMSLQSKKLLSKSGEIYKPNGTQPILNQELKALLQLKEKIQKREAVEAQVHNLQKAITHQLGTEQQLIAEKESLKNALKQVTEQIKHWSAFVDWQQLKRQLADSQETILSEEVKQTLLEVRQQWQFLEGEEKRLLEKSVFSPSENSGPLAFFIDHQHQIITLLNQRLNAEKYQLEYDHLSAVLIEKEGEYQQICLTFQWNPEALPRLVTEAELAEYQELEEASHRLLNEKNHLAQQSELLTKEIEATEGELNHVEKRKETRLSGSSIYYQLGIAVLLTAIPAFFLYQPLIVLSVIAAGFIFYLGVRKNKKQKSEGRSTVAATYAELDQLLEKEQQLIAEEALLEKRGTNWHYEKQRLAQRDGYSPASDISLWIKNQTFLQQGQYLKEQIETTQTRIQTLTNELTKISGSFDFLKGWLPVENANLASCFEELSAFQHEMRQQQHRLQENPQEKTDVKAYFLVKEQIQFLERKHQALFREFQISSLKDLEEILEKNKKQAALQEELQGYERELAPLYPEERRYTEIELQVKVDKLNAKYVQLADALEELQQEKQEVNFQIQHYGQLGDLQSLYQELADLESNIQEHLQSWYAFQLASDMLKQMLTLVGETRLPEVLVMASKYFAILTQQHYREITFHNQGLLILDRDGEAWQAHQLSTATYQQLIFALRFAFIVANRKNCCAPVIIDDGWVYFDEERKGQFFELLNEVSQYTQIICFSGEESSCHFYEEIGAKIIKLE